MNKIKDFIICHKKNCIIGGAATAFVILLLVIFIVVGKSKDSAQTNVEEATTSDMITTDENTADSNSETEDTQEVQTVNPTSEIETVTVQMGNDNVDPEPEKKEDSGVKTDTSGIQNNSYSSTGKTYGIDVSKWQGDINWAKVKASGIEFAFIRVGYRSQIDHKIYEDPYALTNLKGAQAAGIKIGVYFYSTAYTSAEAKEEAAFVYQIIKNYKITYPVVYDCEDSDQSVAQNTANATTFLEYIKSKGYTPMLYGGKNQLTGNGFYNMTTLSSKYKIWIAQYPSTTVNPVTDKSSYTGTHAMWQYSCKGSVPGISGEVDMNVAYFGFDSIASEKETTTAEPETTVKDNTITNETTKQEETTIESTSQKETETTFSQVFTATDVKVTAKDEVNLRDIPGMEGSNVIASIKKGTVISMTGTSDKGWARVVYNGQTLYCVLSLLEEVTE